MATSIRVTVGAALHREGERRSLMRELHEALHGRFRPMKYSINRVFTNAEFRRKRGPQ